MDFWGTCHSYAFLPSTVTGHISGINSALVEGDERADRVPTIIEEKFQQGMKARSSDPITALKTTNLVWRLLEALTAQTPQ